MLYALQGVRFNRATRGRYLALARGRENPRHFSDEGRNRRAYSQAHGLAIEAARAGRLAEAAAREAFAAHYLTDAFAAGHIRASVRAGSLERQRQHDEDGNRGLPVYNDRGDQWVAYGDGNLGMPSLPRTLSHPYAEGNDRNRELAVEALAISRGEVQRPTPEDMEIRERSRRTGLLEFSALQLVPWFDSAHPRATPISSPELCDYVGQGLKYIVLDVIAPAPALGVMFTGAFNEVNAGSDASSAAAIAEGGHARDLQPGVREQVLLHLMSGPTDDAAIQLALVRVVSGASVEERLRLVDRVGIEDLYQCLDDDTTQPFLRLMAPVYALWPAERRLEHLRQRLLGWTQGWEEQVVLTILEASSPQELTQFVRQIGEATLRDELGDHRVRLEQLMRRATRPP